MATLGERLEALRERLLDLSFRNRLLNHADTGRRILKVRRLSLAGLYAMLLSGQLGKCQAKTSSEYVVSAKEESKVGTLDVRIHGDSNYSVVYSAVGPQGSDGIFEPSANQLKQIANLLKDFIKAGICK